MTAHRNWPALTYETLRWVPATTSEWGPGAEYGLRARHYESAVVPLIAAAFPALSQDVAVESSDAERELTRFDAELGFKVAGFAPILLRSEASSSSRIENLTASACAVFSAEIGARVGRNAQEISANTRVMRDALHGAGQLSADTLLTLHGILMEHHPRHTPGQWRNEPVWIGTRSDSPVGATYVAPHHQHITALIEDLIEFIDRNEISPLVSAAIAHAQFETIHPFTDGNGRLGRALVQAMLRQRGVTRNIAVPVSAGLLADVEGYHAALMAYRSGDIDPIIRAFLSATLRAVRNARQLVADIDAIRASWDERLTARPQSNAWKLLDVFARRPVLNSSVAAAELGIQQPNVYPGLRALVESGIVHSQSEHQLGPFWRSDEILAAIDSFAERAGRRSLS